MSICLAMIVKNEEPVIRRAFDSIKNYLDYWVIVDTGSTDRTKEIINEFSKEVPGELIESPWVNFAYNRNESINIAKTKGTYVITMDADEYFLTSDLTDLTNLTEDGYYIRTMYNNLVYNRLLLMSSKRNWQYVGVVHELPTVPNENYNVGVLNNLNLFVTPEGNRSTNPYKFLKDAELLEKALIDEPNNARYVFYLAQSYKDLAYSMPTLATELHKKALDLYKKRLSMEGFYEEKYISHYFIAQLSTDDSEKIYNALEAYNLIPDRIEALHFLIKHYNWTNRVQLAALLMSKAMKQRDPSIYSLFIEQDLYVWGIYDELLVTAYWTNETDKAIKIVGKLKSVWDEVPEYHKPRILKNIEYLEDKIKYKVW